MLRFDLPLCTHTDTEGKPRDARVRNIIQILRKNTIFNEHPVHNMYICAQKNLEMINYKWSEEQATPCPWFKTYIWRIPPPDQSVRPSVTPIVCLASRTIPLQRCVRPLRIHKLYLMLGIVWRVETSNPTNWFSGAIITLWMWLFFKETWSLSFWLHGGWDHAAGVVTGWPIALSLRSNEIVRELEKRSVFAMLPYSYIYSRSFL